ncbi:MAG: hypothetical protein P9L92_07060 [Candidatus Electryonea clarkiae]|nr:hypothetical protein [Candidatus Electryonea clarkiae]MDP8286484.1 hypothetical protein [Candidatus Electryonea clarkiae]
MNKNFGAGRLTSLKKKANVSVWLGVIPAKAGIHCANNINYLLDSCLRRNDMVE